MDDIVLVAVVWRRVADRQGGGVGCRQLKDKSLLHVVYFRLSLAMLLMYKIQDRLGGLVYGKA